MPTCTSPSSFYIKATCVFLWGRNITNLLLFPLACPWHLGSGANVLAPVLALLHSQNIPTVGYLDCLLLKEQLVQVFSVNVQTLKSSGVSTGTDSQLGVSRSNWAWPDPRIFFLWTSSWPSTPKFGLYDPGDSPFTFE